MSHGPADQRELDARSKTSGVQLDAPCPRCAYSQRGAIAAWRDTCPLEGRCAECGLVFIWSEVLRPNLYEPQWCVEYARPRRPWLPPPIRRTLIRSTWPWWFWRSLKMSHPIRVHRLLVYCLILVVMLVLTAAAGQAAIAVAVRHSMAAELVKSRASSLPRWRRHLQVLQQAQQQLQDTEKEEALRIKQQIGIATAALNAPPASVKLSYVAAVAEAVLTPWSSRSRGFVASTWGPGAYPAPRDLHPYLMQRLGSARGATHVDEVRPAAAGMATGLGLAVLMPLSFVLLPVSRHKAKVRWSHIARVVAFGFAILALLGLVAILLVTVSLTTGSVRLMFLLAALRYAPVLLVALWWAAAIRNYLKIPHAWTLTTILTVMNVLLLVAALWLVAPSRVVSALEWSMS